MRKLHIQSELLERIRREPYATSAKNRLHNASASVYDNIKKNNLLLFVQKISIVLSKSKQQLVSIKSDRQTHGI